MSTAVTFDFDPAEGLGDGFFTPVYFDNEVLVKHLYSKTIAVEFASETYGTIYWPDDYMSFGINSKNAVIAWLGDLKELPESEQHHWREHNIASQHVTLPPSFIQFRVRSSGFGLRYSWR